jgi:wyosine [tRNA(Phe)-imidazoG37] synthetase (radical SAM superfamily)
MNPEMIVFGPIPSRRLGRSLGINNIPYKVCSYSCVYCQLGRTIRMQNERSTFYDPETITTQVFKKVHALKSKGESVDYLTFVPDGEPTLDINLGKEIETLKSLGIKIAVITNSSLIWRSDVREDLAKADWVSLKIDSVLKEIWRKIDRPHGIERLEKIMDGMHAFRRNFNGTLATETMLVRNLNDDDESAKQLAEFLSTLRPDIAYLLIPTRPPAEEWVLPPDEVTVFRFYNIVHEKFSNVEFLIGYEGNAFSFTGNAEEDILSITAVHPMREDSVKALLQRAGAPLSVLDGLIATDRLRKVQYQEKTFYIRRFGK